MAEKKSDSVDIKFLFYKFLQYWYLFVIALVLAFMAVHFYVKYSTPEYKVNSRLLVKDEMRGGSVAGTQDAMSSLGGGFNNSSLVDNELEILKTRYIMQQVVGELHLNVGYEIEGRIKDRELWGGTCPVDFQLMALRDSGATNIFNFRFINGNYQTYELLNKEKQPIRQYRFYDTVRLRGLSFVMVPKPGIAFQKDIKITISSFRSVVDGLLGAIKAENNDVTSTVIQLSMLTPTPAKGEDILNKLYEVYTRVNAEDKNKIADSTIRFIDQRLQILEGELSGVEGSIEKFKVQNNIASDLPTQSSLLLNNANSANDQIIAQKVQMDMAASILKKLEAQHYPVVPNAAVIQDPAYSTFSAAYNQLVLSRQHYLENSGEENPVVKDVEAQIRTAKQNLVHALNNVQQNMRIALGSVEKQQSLYKSGIKKAPALEREFNDISRQEAVKEQLYLFLLQRNEETAIYKSGSFSNSRLIDPAKADLGPTKPKKMLLNLIALIAGLVLPIVYIAIRDLFDNKVNNKKDITDATSVPVIGEIGHNHSEDTIVVLKDARSVLAEEFRVLRTNFQFLIQGEKHKLVLLTSSMSGEGKSFISLNLAMSLAISGSKVAIVELDLRKPRISEALKMPNVHGYSSYMISSLAKEELPRVTTANPNLYLVSSGPIPPNPAELLLQPKTAELFNYLKSEFDYVVVDTAPVGLVTDAILIGKLVDASIYVVRQKYTFREQTELINDLHDNHKLPGLAIILNDARSGNGYGYGRGYGYGYGYGRKAYTGYYVDDERHRKRGWKGRWAQVRERLFGR